MRINKVSVVGIDLEFMSCYPMKKEFDHFRLYEKYGLWMSLCISRVVVTVRTLDPWKGYMIFHKVDFGQNK